MFFIDNKYSFLKVNFKIMFLLFEINKINRT